MTILLWTEYIKCSKGLLLRDFSPEIAISKAYKGIDMGITKQAMVLSYMDAFLYLGLMFLICVPFVLILLRNNKGHADVDTSSAH